jgi:RND superfamily putative drug exporter
MKLLGDDCWWAPRWARRLQNRIGLGEIDLPDERKRPTLDGRPTRPPVGAGLVAATPRPPHDPTHPGALEAVRPRPLSAQEVRAAPELAAPSGPAPNTERIQSRQPTQAKTTRLAAPGTQSAPGRERPPAPTPSSGQTRAMPIQTDTDDSDPATEQLNARGQADNGDRRRRGGGGLSAQDLLRREGRL